MYETITHRAFWLAVKKCDACQVCKGNKGCIVAGMEKGNSEKNMLAATVLLFSSQFMKCG